MLKRYYNIKDAADFLNSELKQNLSSFDILEIAARGDIHLCTWFDGLITKFHDHPFDSILAEDNSIYKFRGYIKIPSEVIKPSGGTFYFESIEIAEDIQSQEKLELPKIDPHYFWGTYTCIPETGEIKCLHFEVNSNDALIPTEDILALLSKIQKKGTPHANTANQNKSSMLVILNQASNKFWANADKNDPGTYPKKTVVVAWLEKNGFSQTLAEKGATIIRPEWVPAGRRPEE